MWSCDVAKDEGRGGSWEDQDDLVGMPDPVYHLEVLKGGQWGFWLDYMGDDEWNSELEIFEWSHGLDHGVDRLVQSVWVLMDSGLNDFGLKSNVFHFLLHDKEVEVYFFIELIFLAIHL